MIPILKIPHDAEGIFKKRKNRFLGIVDIEKPFLEKDVPVHIHDSGRLPDLLYPGNKVALEIKNTKSRKTKWDIIKAKDKNFWILTNSSYHNKIAASLIEKEIFKDIKKPPCIKQEPKIGKDRLDLLVKIGETEYWIEVKGCTLEKNNIALFPDAPTQRGRKHLRVLMELKDRGIRNAIIFLVFRPTSNCFMPNKEVDPIFSSLLYNSLKKGISIYPVLLFLKDEYIYYKKILKLCK